MSASGRGRTAGDLATVPLRGVTIHPMQVVSAARSSPQDVLAHRTLPALYVLDADLEVLFARDPRGATAHLGPGAVEVIRRLAAVLDVSVDDVASALVDDDRLVRVVRMDASDRRCFLVFVEPITRRDPVDEASRRFALSPRETEVLRGLVRGDGTASLADRLGIGESTVLEHVKRIGRKLGVTRRVEIVARVLHER